MAREPVKPAKPTVEDLGIDVSTLVWRQAGDGPGSLEVAMVKRPSGHWVLLRVADDAVHRVLVYDAHEWECFLDGAGNGEFDDALENGETAVTDVTSEDRWT